MDVRRTLRLYVESLLPCGRMSADQRMDVRDWVAPYETAACLATFGLLSR